MDKAVTNAIIESVGGVQIVDSAKFSDVKKSYTTISSNLPLRSLSRIPKKTETSSSLQMSTKKSPSQTLNTNRVIKEEIPVLDKSLRVPTKKSENSIREEDTTITTRTALEKRTTKIQKPSTQLQSRAMPFNDKKRVVQPPRSASKMSLTIPKPTLMPRSEKSVSNRSVSKMSLNIPNNTTVNSNKIGGRLTIQKSFSCIGENKRVKPTGFHTERGLSSGTSPIDSTISMTTNSSNYNNSNNSNNSFNRKPIQSARGRVSEKINMNLFENAHRKLQVVQAQFLRHYENVKDILDNKQNTEYKLVAMQKDSNLKFILKEQEDEIPATPKPTMKPVAEYPFNSNEIKNNLELFIEQYNRYLIHSLESVFKEKCAGDFASSTGEGGLNFSKNFAEFRSKLEREKNQQLEEVLKKLENCIATEGTVNFDLETRANNLQKELQESKKMLQQHEKQVKDLKKYNEETIGKLNKDMASKEKILAQKETELAEFQKKYRQLETESNKKKTTAHKLLLEHQSKSERLEKELQQMKELADKNENRLRLLQDQLKSEKKACAENEIRLKEQEMALVKAAAELEEIQNKSNAMQSNSETSCPAEINDCKSNVDLVLISGENEKLRREVEQLKSELSIANSMVEKLSAADHEAKKCIAELQSKIDTYSNQIPIKEVPKEVQNELIKLRNSESDKRREIEKLKSELSRAHFEIQQLEERVQCDQQLLKVRSELISSLQSNEKSHRIHLDELYVNIAEKNNQISELDNELQTKTEEFQNLFSTLSTKQLELSRQAHMIKLLEESNDRSQILRVKQEEKIARMAEEIIHLKQSLDFYQDSVLPNNPNRRNSLFNSTYLDNGKHSGPDSDETCKDNLYYYTSERQRKRKVDINVKKYET